MTSSTVTPLAARLRGFGTTIFAEMTELAERTGAINLGQGFPDSDGPASLLMQACKAIRTGYNQYPPGAGLAELREAISEHRGRRYGTWYDPKGEVLVTTGATEAIAASMLALCDPGDEVIVFDPCYDSYAASVAMAGGVLRPVLLRPVGDRFAFDPAELRAAVSPRTKLLLLNTPHNPTAKVFTRQELEAVAAVAREHDLLVVTDEVHEHLVYDGLEHVTLASLPGMRERTLVISSAGKTFSVTGWKVGWACGPRPLVEAVRTAKQFLTFGSGTPMQRAVSGMLLEHQAWTVRLQQSLQQARDLLCQGLKQAGFFVYRSEGTYFVQVDVRGWGYDDGVAFCRDLPERAGVVAIPSAAFYQSTGVYRWLARFTFCKRPKVLEEAVRRLLEAA